MVFERNADADVNMAISEEDDVGALNIKAKLDTALIFFFSSRRRHTRCSRDWSSDVCSSDLHEGNLWIGTDGGLSCWKDHHFITFTVKDGLSTNSISAIYEDTGHSLWIGTHGDRKSVV